MEKLIISVPNSRKSTSSIINERDKVSCLFKRKKRPERISSAVLYDLSMPSNRSTYAPESVPPIVMSPIEAFCRETLLKDSTKETCVITDGNVRQHCARFEEENVTLVSAGKDKGNLVRGDLEITDSVIETSRPNGDGLTHGSNGTPHQNCLDANFLIEPDTSEQNCINIGSALLKNVSPLRSTTIKVEKQQGMAYPVNFAEKLTYENGQQENSDFKMGINLTSKHIRSNENLFANHSPKRNSGLTSEMQESPLLDSVANENYQNSLTEESISEASRQEIDCIPVECERKTSENIPMDLRRTSIVLAVQKLPDILRKRNTNKSSPKNLDISLSLENSNIQSLQQEFIVNKPDLFSAKTVPVLSNTTYSSNSAFSSCTPPESESVVGNLLEHISCKAEELSLTEQSHDFTSSSKCIAIASGKPSAIGKDENESISFRASSLGDVSINAENQGSIPVNIGPQKGEREILLLGTGNSCSLSHEKFLPTGPRKELCFVSSPCETVGLQETRENTTDSSICESVSSETQTAEQRVQSPATTSLILSKKEGLSIEILENLNINSEFGTGKTANVGMSCEKKECSIPDVDPVTETCIGSMNGVKKVKRIGIEEGRMVLRSDKTLNEIDGQISNIANKAVKGRSLKGTSLKGSSSDSVHNFYYIRRKRNRASSVSMQGSSVNVMGRDYSYENAEDEDPGSAPHVLTHRRPGKTKRKKKNYYDSKSIDLDELMPGKERPERVRRLRKKEKRLRGNNNESNFPKKRARINNAGVSVVLTNSPSVFLIGNETEINTSPQVQSPCESPSEGPLSGPVEGSSARLANLQNFSQEIAFPEGQPAIVAEGHFASSNTPLKRAFECSLLAEEYSAKPNEMHLCQRGNEFSGRFIETRERVSPEASDQDPCTDKEKISFIYNRFLDDSTGGDERCGTKEAPPGKLSDIKDQKATAKNFEQYNSGNSKPIKVTYPVTSADSTTSVISVAENEKQNDRVVSSESKFHYNFEAYSKRIPENHILESTCLDGQRRAQVCSSAESLGECERKDSCSSNGSSDVGLVNISERKPDLDPSSALSGLQHSSPEAKTDADDSKVFDGEASRQSSWGLANKLKGDKRSRKRRTKNILGDSGISARSRKRNSGKAMKISKEKEMEVSLKSGSVSEDFREKFDAFDKVCRVQKGKLEPNENQNVITNQDPVNLLKSHIVGETLDELGKSKELSWSSLCCAKTLLCKGTRSAKLVKVSERFEMCNSNSQGSLISNVSKSRRKTHSANYDVTAHASALEKEKTIGACSSLAFEPKAVDSESVIRPNDFESRKQIDENKAYIESRCQKEKIFFSGQLRRLISFVPRIYSQLNTTSPKLSEKYRFLLNMPETIRALRKILEILMTFPESVLQHYEASFIKSIEDDGFKPCDLRDSGIEGAPTKLYKEGTLLSENSAIMVKEGDLQEKRQIPLYIKKEIICSSPPSIESLSQKVEAKDVLGSHNFLQLFVNVSSYMVLINPFWVMHGFQLKKKGESEKLDEGSIKIVLELDKNMEGEELDNFEFALSRKLRDFRPSVFELKNLSEKAFFPDGAHVSCSWFFKMLSQWKEALLSKREKGFSRVLPGTSPNKMDENHFFTDTNGQFLLKQSTVLYPTHLEKLSVEDPAPIFLANRKNEISLGSVIQRVESLSFLHLCSSHSVFQKNYVRGITLSLSLLDG